MIRVAKAAEPTTFHAAVRVPGLRAIAELVGEKPTRTAGRRYTKIADRREDIPADKFPPYWTSVLDDLMKAYNYVCAYSCFRIHEVSGAQSVDHFAPKSRAWADVYEWHNYRLACSRLNARKTDFSGLHDPFQLADGWFQLELVGFQVVPDPGLIRLVREAIQNTIDTLRLNDFCRQRASDAEDSWRQDVSFRILTRESPFVAKELRRQGRLNAGDA